MGEKNGREKEREVKKVSYEKAAEHSMLSDLICKREKKNIPIKNYFSCPDMTLSGRDD